MNSAPTPSLTRRRFELSTMAAIAGLGLATLAPPTPRFDLLTAATLRPRKSRREARAIRTAVYRPPSMSFTPEKYPGQRRAHLVGAHRPMTAAEISAHNADLAARKAGAA